MAMIIEGGDFSGYDSNIPIQSIINFIESNYNCRYSSAGYGKYSADLSFCFENDYRKFPTSFFGWLWYGLFPKNYRKVKDELFFKRLRAFLDLRNYHNVIIENNSKYSIKLKYLKEEEFKEHQLKEKMKDKLINFN